MLYKRIYNYSTNYTTQTHTQLLYKSYYTNTYTITLQIIYTKAVSVGLAQGHLQSFLLMRGLAVFLFAA